MPWYSLKGLGLWIPMFFPDFIIFNSILRMTLHLNDAKKIN